MTHVVEHRDNSMGWVVALIAVILVALAAFWFFAGGGRGAATDGGEGTRIEVNTPEGGGSATVNP
jgi:hypothetical protein